jgi:hypothetical protein
MKQYITKLYNGFRSRFNFWLTLVILPVFFFVPWWWLAVGIIVNRIVESINIAMYHDYANHRLIKPKNKIIEALGWYIICAFNAQAPWNKIKYHWMHHEYYETEKDATWAKLQAMKDKDWWKYLVDLGPHVAMPYILEADCPMPKSKVYDWFNTNWQIVFVTNIVLWLALGGWWVFVAWFVFPIWFWGCIFRWLNWGTHKLQKPDTNISVLLYGTQAWHHRHHDEYLTEYEPYYGEGFWRWLNIDWYSQKVFFKQMSPEEQWPKETDGL